MASILSIHDMDATQKAMLDGLRSHLESAIRAQFQPIAKKAVDDAVAEAMKTFTAALETFVQHKELGYFVRVTLNDQRSKDQP